MKEINTRASIRGNTVCVKLWSSDVISSKCAVSKQVHAIKQEESKSVIVHVSLVYFAA